MRTLLTITFLVALAACHSSTTIGGDTGTDSPADTAVDVPPDASLECPPHGGASVSWTIDGTDWPEETDIEQECTIHGITGDGERRLVIMLRCEPHPGTVEDHTIAIESDPPAHIAPLGADRVILKYVADPIWWINRWFSLQTEYGELIVAGVDADRVVPSGSDTDDWFHVVEVSVAGGLCPAREGFCGTLERQALDVTYAEWDDLVFDGHHATLGTLTSVEVTVGRADTYVEMDCEDVPLSWYTALITLVPGG